ncbi:MAG: hypothetical protein IV107_22510 [Paucibacter sp.]|nr:hypothetical protein [Roseateles sp.]
MRIASFAALLAALAHCGNTTAETKSLTLDGRFEYRTDAESQSVIGDQICFFPSAKSSPLLPRWSGDQRLAWFCFSQTARAAKQLSIPLQFIPGTCGVAGTATVEIDDYVVYASEGDGNDSAALRSVLKKSTAIPLPCEN